MYQFILAFFNRILCFRITIFENQTKRKLHILIKKDSVPGKKNPDLNIPDYRIIQQK